MIIPAVFLTLLGVVLVWRRVHVVRRRRDERTMVVGTYPDIELSQRYGGWNAEAYDAHSGRDRSWAVGTSRAFSAGRQSR